MKQVERKLKRLQRDRGQKESGEEIQSKQISSARDFHVFEHIHNPLTSRWVDSYLWAASARVKGPITARLSKTG